MNDVRGGGDIRRREVTGEKGFPSGRVAHAGREVVQDPTGKFDGLFEWCIADACATTTTTTITIPTRKTTKI